MCTEKKKEKRKMGNGDKTGKDGETDMENHKERKKLEKKGKQKYRDEEVR